MALKKTKILDNGAIGEYWCISTAQMVKKTDGVQFWYIRMELYTSEDGKKVNDFKPLETIEVPSIIISIPLSEFQQVGNDPYKILYPIIKQSRMVNEVETNWFADAEDC